ncbi:uncharacterized protein LOC116252859 [Nymphaea colorata]|nr:uncharacterized protein LOC116252859 [Nymphaea colorata]
MRNWGVIIASRMNAGASNYGDSKKGKKVVAVKELASRYEEQEDVVGRDDEELKSLLPLQKEGSFKGGANGGTESRRKVQWNDKDGDKLAQVREFVPSDSSDNDCDEDDLDSCLCVIV